MSKNIEINIKTENGYELLYPKTFEYGTFIGTGTHNEWKPATLVFNKRPKWIIFPNYVTIIFSGMVDSGKSSPAEDGGNQYCGYSWSGNTLSWSSSAPEYDKEIFMDVQGKTYYYFALY